MIDERQAEEILGQAERAARSLGFDGVELHVSCGRESLTRFANNAIHQNVAEQSSTISVRLFENQRTGRASTNRTGLDAIRQLVEDAAAITRASAPDPQLLPLAEAAPFSPIDRHAASTASATPAVRASLVAGAIRVVRDASLTAAGICSTSDNWLGLLNSRGVRAFHSETMAVFSITALGSDSSGWAKSSSVGLDSLDANALARSAAHKAKLSASPRVMPPEKFTVVLEPSAVVDLIGQFAGDFSATAVHDQRSAFTGRTPGEALFSPRVQVWDDYSHPLQNGAPSDGEGVPRQKLQLVKDGVLQKLPCCRSAAHALGQTPTGHGFVIPNELGEAAGNLVFGGGTATVDEMIRSTARGLLLTRVWYIRDVDPYEKVLTGMTRDGTFLIEGGELVAGVRNFRFNQSVFEMLKRVEMMGEPVRACGEEAADMVVPAMKVPEFGFTEVTKF